MKPLLAYLLLTGGGILILTASGGNLSEEIKLSLWLLLVVGGIGLSFWIRGKEAYHGILTVAVWGAFGLVAYVALWLMPTGIVSPGATVLLAVVAFGLGALERYIFE